MKESEMQYLDAISKMTEWSICFQSKPFDITVIQVYAPTSNAEEAEVEQFYEDLQELLELTPKKDVLFIIGAAAAKSLQSCPTLWDPIDGSPPGSPVPGILQVRTLEGVAISFSNAWKWIRSVMSDSSWPHGLQPTRLLRPWNFPGKSTGMGCYYLLWVFTLDKGKKEKKLRSGELIFKFKLRMI